MSLSPDKKHFISFCLTSFFRCSAPIIKSSTTCLLFSSNAKLNSSFISFIFLLNFRMILLNFVGISFVLKFFLLLGYFSKNPDQLFFYYYLLVFFEFYFFQRYSLILKFIFSISDFIFIYSSCISKN